MSGDASEIVDSVDASDNVIGSISRGRIAQVGANHRVVHVLVVDARGRLLLQRVAPRLGRAFSHGSSAAGHVRAGESYEEAARREFAEELGIPSGPLIDLGRTWLDEGGRRKFAGVYLCRGPAAYVPDPLEVAGLEWRDIADVRGQLRERDGVFSSTFERVFRHVDVLDAWARFE